MVALAGLMRPRNHRNPAADHREHNYGGNCGDKRQHKQRHRYHCQIGSREEVSESNPVKNLCALVIENFTCVGPRWNGFYRHIVLRERPWAMDMPGY